LGLKKKSAQSLIVPIKNANEAAVVVGIEIYPMSSLSEVVRFLIGEETRKPHEVDRATIFQHSKTYDVDFADVKGQTFAKRALEIAAGGTHNAVLVGPPGSGKTLLARRLPTILPDMDFDEALETTKIHSVAGYLRDSNNLVATRPFRSPHHQVSDVALIGGGTNPRPGEVSLAHRGVLFLDEFPEFGRNVLEALRQPLEDRFVTVVRVAGSVCYPSDFLLLAAANPCPCGYLGSQVRACTCLPTEVQKYRGKISGPLLDRIDLHVEVPSLKLEEITGMPHGNETSAHIKERVVHARLIQKKRFEGTGLLENGQMGVKQIHKFCVLNEEGKNLLKNAIKKLGLSARAYDRILKVSRTIADLEGVEKIKPAHLAEAISYRFLDRSGNV
jgi:magnesium chelatase family protein